MARLTKRLVEQLPPGQNAWDSELKGFGVRCRSSNVRSYVVKYHQLKRQRMYTISRHGSPWTTETARKEAKRLLGVIATGQDPSAERQSEKGILTVADVAELFLRHHCEAKLKLRSIKRYRRNLDLDCRYSELDLTKVIGAKWVADKNFFLIHISGRM